MKNRRTLLVYEDFIIQDAKTGNAGIGMTESEKFGLDACLMRPIIDELGFSWATPSKGTLFMYIYTLEFPFPWQFA